jgi:ADP-ribosylglycohydrolase
MTMDGSDKFCGLLLGMAVGDAIGLPREGLSPRRARRMFGEAPLRHRLILRRGMISDDTEHACMTAEALLQSGGEAQAFRDSLAWRLRGWLLGMPAGIGLATLRSILKLWCGVRESGVYSAGNGPAMRAPILGVWAAASGMGGDGLRALVSKSTRLTHTDPRATEGALAIAIAAHDGAKGGFDGLLKRLKASVKGEELIEHLRQMESHVSRGAEVREFAEHLGLQCGVTGYINHTVPVALYCCLRWRTNFRRAVEEVVELGGDTDTTGAIVGGIMGATLGVKAIPPEWIDGLLEWPRSASWMKRLGERLAAAATPHSGPRPGKPLPLLWPALLPRNVFFAAAVIAHGVRRILPPY